MTNAELNNFKEVNSARLLIEELTTPLTTQFKQVVSRVNQLHEMLVANTAKIAEIEIFFRRITFFQRDFDNIWNQVQELEIYRSINEKRREGDLNEVANNINKVKAFINDMQGNVKANSAGISTLSKQYNTLVHNTIEYKEVMNEKYCEIEKVANNTKDYCNSNMESIQVKVAKALSYSDGYGNQFKELSAELQIYNQRLTGKYYEKRVELERKVEQKRVKEIKRLEDIVEDLREQVKILLKKEDGVNNATKEYIESRLKARRKSIEKGKSRKNSFVYPMISIIENIQKPNEIIFTKKESIMEETSVMKIDTIEEKVNEKINKVVFEVKKESKETESLQQFTHEIKSIDKVIDHPLPNELQTEPNYDNKTNENIKLPTEKPITTEEIFHNKEAKSVAHSKKQSKASSELQIPPNMEANKDCVEPSVHKQEVTLTNEEKGESKKPDIKEESEVPLTDDAELNNNEVTNSIEIKKEIVTSSDNLQLADSDNLINRQEFETELKQTIQYMMTSNEEKMKAVVNKLQIEIDSKIEFMEEKFFQAFSE